MQDTLTREDYDLLMAVVSKAAKSKSNRATRRNDAKPAMTLEELETIPGEFLLPVHVARLLRCDAQTIRWNARDGLCEFPVVLVGCRVKIPKRAFIAYMKGDTPCERPTNAST